MEFNTPSCSASCSARSTSRLYTSFSKQDFSTERARGLGVPKAELQLKQKAEESRRGRDIGAWFLMIGGAINTIQGGILLGEDIVNRDDLRLAGPIALLVGLGQLVLGWHTHSTPSSVEKTWTTYSHDPAVQQRSPE